MKAEGASLHKVNTLPAPNLRAMTPGGGHPLWPPMAAYEIFSTIGGGSAYSRLWLPNDFLSRIWMTT